MIDEGLWIRNLLNELNIVDSAIPTPIFCDNHAAILNLGKLPEDWTRVHLNTKHFRCARLCMDPNKQFEPFHIPGLINPADIFTKSLAAPDYSRLKEVLLNSTLFSFLDDYFSTLGRH